MVDGIRTALPTTNPYSVWYSQFYDGYSGGVPPADADTAFRHLSVATGTRNAIPSTGELITPAVQVVGQFDPSRLPSFSPLSRVPLETYFPPEVTGADAASRAALGNKTLLPDSNIAGYLTQPPAMLTTLQAASQSFWNPKIYQGAPKAPISYIRVRVSGVTGPDPLSVARIKAVAVEIHKATGLTVDITAGSSPAPQTINLPAGKFGRPALQVSEGWVEKNVSVVFLHATDRKSLVLFVLVLVVCLLFLANAAVAAERARRVDLGVLSCLGWSRRPLFGYVLGQQALVGLVAGLAGTGLAAIIVVSFGLRIAGWRLALITPVAVILACLAGLQAALRASRARPMDAVAAPVARQRRAGRVRSVARLAVANVRRFPGRSLAGGAALFVAVAALTIVVGIALSYRGVLVGTLLGDAISVQVRGADYLAAGLTLALGALSLADVVFLNLTERGDEIATLLALGWRDRTVRTLFALEGLLVTIVGSVLGAAAGVAFVISAFNVGVGSVLVAAGVAAAAGFAATAVAMLVPLSQVARRGPAAQLAIAE